MPEASEGKEFQGLIFLDLDGTIEDSRLDMAGSANRVRKQLGLQQKEVESFFPFVMKGMEYLYRQCFPECFQDPGILGLEPEATEQSSELSALQSLALLYHRDYSEHIVQHTRMYPNMPEALKELHGRYYLGLYTNKPESLSRLLLSALGILEYFELLYGGDTLAESKPSALPINTGIQSLAGILPEAERSRLTKEGQTSMQGTDRNPDGGSGSLSPATERPATLPELIRKRTVMVGDSGGDLQAARQANVKSVWASYGYYADQPDSPADAVASSPSELVHIIPELLQGEGDAMRRADP